jgi:hypothetical protein
MTNGNFGSDGEFNLLVQKLKRGHMMDAFIKEGDDREFGLMIL